MNLSWSFKVFQKDKTSGPDGWTIEFFLDLFELLGEDLLRVIEDTRLSGGLLDSFNSTFIALIPKVDNHVTLSDFYFYSSKSHANNSFYSSKSHKNRCPCLSLKWVPILIAPNLKKIGVHDYL